MFNTPNVGLADRAPAPDARLGALVVTLLVSVAVALHRLDWWKLLELAGRPPSGRNLWLQAAAVGMTFTDAAAGAEELACPDESHVRDALKHAAARAILEVATFYALLTLTVACGLSSDGDDDTGLLAYLADTFAGGWGEAVVYAIACAVSVAACRTLSGVTREGFCIASAMTQATPVPPWRSGGRLRLCDDTC